MRQRVVTLLRKEWAELLSRRGLVITTFLLPVLFLAIPFGVAVGIPAVAGERAYNDPDLERAFQVLRAHAPELAALGQKEMYQVFILRQFMIFLLFLPVTTSLTIATYSIVGEKVSRSLEPLLATPITTAELLLGKALASALPAVVVTWVAFAVYATGTLALTSPSVFTNVIGATALCIIFVVGPLIAILGLSLAIIASARSNDPRSAQQIVVVVILPLVALIIAQVMGLFLLTAPLVLLGGAALAVIDLLVLKIGVALFERETILTRWK